jgi:hypothetical protein
LEDGKEMRAAGMPLAQRFPVIDTMGIKVAFSVFERNGARSLFVPNSSGSPRGFAVDVHRWRCAANNTTSRIFRAISRYGTPWGKGLSENIIWYVVRRQAKR